MQTAPQKEQDIVGQTAGLTVVMCGEDQPRAGRFRRLQDRLDFSGRTAIQCGTGLIQKQQLGLADQGAGEGQFLLLATRKHRGCAPQKRL